MRDFLRRHQLGSVLVALALLVGVYIFVFAPPLDFPVGERVTIDHGASVSNIADELSQTNVIQHGFVLKFLLRVSGMSNRVQAGVYLFDSREDVFVIAYRLVVGSYHLAPAYITFPEGVTVSDIAEKIAATLPLISPEDIIATGTPQEGYLFPDTYLFPPNATANSVVETMHENFNVKIAPFLPEVQSSGHSLADIVTMASILEKEAQSNTDKKIVAGILWNRLSRGMALQVDADPETYAHKGLPPAPICNPGLSSIEAALNPTETKYVYYLSDKNGVLHYATTYAEQQANEAKYLH